MDVQKATARKKTSERKQFRTIVVVNIPNDLLNKDLLFRHFSKFGEIVRTVLSQKNKHATLSFSEPAAATAAKEQGTIIAPNRPPLVIYYSDKALDSSGKTVPSRPVIKRDPGPAVPELIGVPTSSNVVKMSPVKIPKPVSVPSTGETSVYAFHPDTSEAQELFSRRAVTAEEKYRLLEARDKLIRARNPKVKMRVEFAVKLAGTCKDMCPEKERYMREVQRQLASFEMTAGKDGEVDHRLAIKAYARSSADQEEPLPHELRPSETLEMSMAYILHNIIPRQDTEDLANWYNFVWDRTRSIRKDITQQQLCDLRSVAMMEKCTRFHIHCSSRLCELDRFSFDAKLNDENLMKCLQSLEHMYTDLNILGVTCPNEPEFRAYQILMNLNEGDILWEIQQKPDRILRSPEVQYAIKIHMSMFEKNYALFFSLVNRAPYLTACILHRYFFQVRSTALRTIFKAYSAPKSSSENYTSLSAIRHTLGFGDTKPELFEYFCTSHGILSDFEKDRLLLNRKTFEMPDLPSITREHYLIESKLNSPLNVIINGGPLGSNPYPEHSPHTSFNDQGYLIPGELIGVPEKSVGKVMVKSEGVVKTATSSSSSAVPTGTGQLASFSWSLPVAPSPGKTVLSIFRQPPPIIKTESSPSSSSAVPPVSTPAPPFGFQPPTGLPTSSPWMFRGTAAAPDVMSTPQPVPPPAPPPNKPLVFPTFTPVIPRPPEPAPSPAIIREQKVKNMSGNVFTRLADSAIRSVCEDALRVAREARRREIERHALLDRSAAAVYARLEQSVIENEVRMFWVRRRQIQVLVESKGKQLSGELFHEINVKRVRAISTECYHQAVKEREAKLTKLEELTSRIRVRFWVAKWKVYTERRKMERERLLERKIKELENFPSYQNTYLLSSEEILRSWCGDPIEDRRRKTLCSPTRFFNWRGNPKFSSSPHCRLNKRGPGGGGERGDRVGGEDDKEAVAQPNISDEQILRVVQLYDFPAAANFNNATPQSMLASWCGHRTGGTSPSSSKDDDDDDGRGGGRQEWKKRRLDAEL